MTDQVFEDLAIFHSDRRQFSEREPRASGFAFRTQRQKDQNEKATTANLGSPRIPISTGSLSQIPLNTCPLSVRQDDLDFDSIFQEIDKLQAEMNSTIEECREIERRTFEQQQKKQQQKIKKKKKISQALKDSSKKRKTRVTRHSREFFKLVEGLCFRHKGEQVEELRDKMVADVLGLQLQMTTEEDLGADLESIPSEGGGTQRTYKTLSSLAYPEEDMTSLLDLLKYIRGEDCASAEEYISRVLRKLKHANPVHRILQAASEVSRLPWIYINTKYEFYKHILNPNAVCLVYEDESKQFLMVEARRQSEQSAEQQYNLFMLSTQKRVGRIDVKTFKTTYSQIYVFFPQLCYLQAISNKLLQVRVSTTTELVVQANSVNKRDAQLHRILIFRKHRLQEDRQQYFEFVDGDFAKHEPLSLHVQLSEPGDYVIYTSQSVPQHATIFYNRELEFRVLERSSQLEYSLLSSLDTLNTTTQNELDTPKFGERHLPEGIRFYRIEMLKVGLVLEKYINATQLPVLFTDLQTEPDDRTLLFSNTFQKKKISEQPKCREKEVLVSRDQEMLKIYEICEIPAHLPAPEISVSVYSHALPTTTLRKWDHL